MEHGTRTATPTGGHKATRHGQEGYNVPRNYKHHNDRQIRHEAQYLPPRQYVYIDGPPNMTKFAAQQPVIKSYIKLIFPKVGPLKGTDVSSSTVHIDKNMIWISISTEPATLLSLSKNAKDATVNAKYNTEIKLQTDAM